MDRWFFNPSFLWFALVAVVPWLWMLIRKPEYEPHPWGASRLLEAAYRQVQPRIRWRQWWLLIVQTLIAVLLSLALAGPRAAHEETAQAATTAKPTWWVLVLDDSLSMHYVENGLSHFDEAREAAARLVEQSLPGDAFSILGMTDGVAWQIDGPAFDDGEVRRALEQARAGFDTADLGETLTHLERLVTLAPTDAKHFHEIQIVFYTDLADATWSGASVPEVQRAIHELSLAARCQVIDVGQFSAGNISLGPLQSVPRLAVSGRSHPIWVDVFNRDEQQGNEVSLRLEVDGEFRESRQVRLDGQSRQRVRFDVTLHGFGQHVIEVHTDDDTLSADSRRWAVTEVPEVLQVVVWSELADERVAMREGIAAAVGEDQPVDIRLGTVRDLTGSSPRETVLMLGTVSRWPGGGEDELRAFVEAGGTVIAFLGPDSQPWRWLGRWRPGWQEPDGWQVVEGEPLSLLSPQDSVASLRVFQGPASALLTRTPVWKQWRLPDESESGVEVWLETQEAGPLLASLSEGDGHMLLWLSSLVTERGEESEGRDWSALGLWPSYPVLLERSLDSLAGGERSEWGFELSGTEGDVARKFLRSWQHLEARDPSREVFEGEASRELETRRELETGLRTTMLVPGIYVARDEGFEPRYRVVNTSVSETDPQRRVASELPRWFQSGESFEAGAAGSRSRQVRTSQPYQWLLAVVLALLMVEVHLATRARRRSRSVDVGRPRS